MHEFHAIVVNKSLINESLIDDFDVIGKQSDNWVLYKIKVLEDDIKLAISNIQANMHDGPWYLHFYNRDGSKLIVVFKDQSFVVTNDKTTWADAIKHGKQLGTPIEQLDFTPNTFDSEEY